MDVGSTLKYIICIYKKCFLIFKGRASLRPNSMARQANSSVPRKTPSTKRLTRGISPCKQREVRLRLADTGRY
jgi:serine/threonine protein kinase